MPFKLPGMHDVDDSHEMHAPGIQNTGDPVVDSSQHSTRPQTRKKSTLADIARTLSMQLHPQRPVAEAPGFLQGVKAIIFGSYLNVLLVCIPVSLFSHKGLYEDSNDEIMKSKKYVNVKMPFKKHSRQSILGTVNSAEPEIIVSGDMVASTSTHLNGGAMNIHDNTSSESHMATNASEAEAGRALLHREEHQEEVEEVEIPTMSLSMTIGLLAVVTVLVAVTAEWLVSSIDGLTASGHITKEFVGIILLPIVGNAAEHVTAVTVSVKDKLTLSLGVAVGSSIVCPSNPIITILATN
ncbi:hypothetical protein PHLCEN_2v7240 [Hermanssonia centrifuga]|uniref:Sodium/calcium exchanger membrane region domain-containing protein n=1 Tax=Hermanssonia centrifuga TaxID=98765 RepID=A0A2R6NXC3_9APHY|nr:hypothetical protein PHLCEN_2v7240 [Hermanssonia centrifuga]